MPVTLYFIIISFKVGQTWHVPIQKCNF